MPVTERFAEEFGLLGQKTSWQTPGMTVSDFSSANVAGAGVIRQTAMVIPLTNPAKSAIKSPDPIPSDEPAGTLAAASGGRVVGSGRVPFAVLMGASMVHITTAGGVYNPATTSVLIRIFNTVTTVVGAITSVTASLNLATAPNGIDPFVMAVPAERLVGLEGVAGLATGGCALFNGDVVVVELTTAGALNIQNVACVAAMLDIS